MSARDGASSVQGVMLRATRLTQAGAIDSTYPVLTTKGFISATFTHEFDAGDDLVQKAADGSICVSFQGDDSLKRLAFKLDLCSPDPEVYALLSGGNVLMDSGGNVTGYTSVAVGSLVGNPVAIEIWSIANINGKPSSDKPYFHWVFPYVKVHLDGDRVFTNGLLGNSFIGQAIGNSALVTAGLNPAISATDDFVVYREALINPFTYVRTTGFPSTAPLFNGSYPTIDSTITPYVTPTSATAGVPGSFGPTGATAPYALANLIALGALGNAGAWTVGQYVVLGDGSFAHWTGSAWASGTA